MKKKVWYAVAAVVVLAVVLLILLPSGKEVVALEKSETSRISISNSVIATGTLEPVTTVDVGTQVSGIIDKLYADYNDVVKAGQLLAEMDRVTLQAELESSLASEAYSKNEFEYQEKNYNRIKGLYEKELISESEYDEAYYTYIKAKNSYDQAKADIVKVRKNLEYATINSPIDGVVISKAVEEGQTVAAGFETPTLFTIANDLTKMEVIADVDEADIGQVKEGQRVSFTVDAFPNDTFEGEVTQVRLEATEESNVITYEVVISAANDELKLMPGMTANVTIYTIEEDNVLAVPSKALKFNPDAEMVAVAGYELDQSAVSGSSVWVVNGKKLQRRAVTSGNSSGDMTEIKEGLTDGETVAYDLNVVVAKKEKKTERSPFMPSGPGGNQNDKERK